MTRSLPTDDPSALGPFELTGRLDETPAGIVYQGTDPHGRQICLAVLNQGAAGDAAARDRFRAAILAEPLDQAPPNDTAAIVGAEPEGPTPWVATLYEPGSRGAERFLGPVLLQGARGRFGHRRGPLFQPHWLGSREPALRPKGRPLRDLARDRGIAATILMVAALLVLLAVLMLLLFACRPPEQSQPTPTPVFPAPTQVSPSQSPSPSPSGSQSPSPSRTGTVRPTETDGDGGQGNGGDA